MRVQLDLPCRPDSIGRARDCVGELSGELSGRRLGDLRLLVSEVVTNAVRHAGLEPTDTIRLSMVVKGGLVRVEVGDRGRGFAPRPRDPDIRTPGGWGLYLVEELAERWGVRSAGGALVWFELSLS